MNPKKIPLYQPTRPPAKKSLVHKFSVVVAVVAPFENVAGNFASKGENEEDAATATSSAWDLTKETTTLSSPPAT